MLHITVFFALLVTIQDNGCNKDLGICTYNPGHILQIYSVLAKALFATSKIELDISIKSLFKSCLLSCRMT